MKYTPNHMDTVTSIAHRSELFELSDGRTCEIIDLVHGTRISMHSGIPIEHEVEEIVMDDSAVNSMYVQGKVSDT